MWSIRDGNVNQRGLQEGSQGHPPVSQALAHPEGDEFLLLFARLLASVCKLLVQSRPILYSVAQKNRMIIIFFSSVIQRAEVWGNCQGLVSRGCNKMCGLLTLQRLFQFIQMHSHKPMFAGDRQCSIPFSASKAGTRLK